MSTRLSQGSGLRPLESWPDRGRLRLWPIRTALGVSFLAAGLGLFGLTWLALLLLPGTASLHDRISALQLVFASVAGAGALVALVVAYRRQKVAEADSAHDRARVFNERFTAVAAQLGDEQPAVRLAGVHAMAGLADDWEGNRQTCIDVLCAYLRMPYEPDPGEEAPPAARLTFRAIREIRHTAIRVITTHLREGAAVSWQGLDFDLTNVVFDGGSFDGAVFSGGRVSFNGAVFCGNWVSFSGAVFSGAEVIFGGEFSGAEVSFDRSEFSGGTVVFAGEVSGGRVSFDGAVFSGGKIGFGGDVSGGEVYLRRAVFSGAEVAFGGEFSGGTVSFNECEFKGGRVLFCGRFSGSQVDFGAKFSGGQVDFGRPEFSFATVSVGPAEFSGGTLSFNRSEFSGGTIRFSHARFSGGAVDFSQVADWSHPPEFFWIGAPPPGVKLPQEEDQSQT